jgi:Class III cytochrome C family
MRKEPLCAILLALILAFQLGSTASAQQAASKGSAEAPDVIILKGAPMGGVKFRHILHSEDRQIKCETCHHASRMEKPATSPLQPCSECHTKVAAAPMKTNIQAAFHDSMAKAGLCIDCHKAEKAAHKYKLPPVKCQDCHDKANVLADPRAGT